jgi:hypothetical protein
MQNKMLNATPFCTEWLCSSAVVFCLAGKIYEHKVNNITMSPDNYLSIFSRMLSFNLARAQTPTPSFFTLARGSRRSLQNTSEQLRRHITSCLRTRREMSTGV